MVEGSRQILFGLHSRIGLDFGILFAWAAVNTAVVSKRLRIAESALLTRLIVPSRLLVPHVQAQARGTRVLRVRNRDIDAEKVEIFLYINK